jgi:hypothetical protein
MKNKTAKFRGHNNDDETYVTFFSADGSISTRSKSGHSSPDYQPTSVAADMMEMRLALASLHPLSEGTGPTGTEENLRVVTEKGYRSSGGAWSAGHGEGLPGPSRG